MRIKGSEGLMTTASRLDSSPGSSGLHNARSTEESLIGHSPALREAMHRLTADPEAVDVGLEEPRLEEARGPFHAGGRDREPGQEADGEADWEADREAEPTILTGAPAES